MSTLRERVMMWPKGIRIALWLLLQPVRLVLWLVDALLTAPGIALLVLVLAVLGAVVGYRNLHGGEFDFELFIEDFYANLSTELISIAITVLVIDGLYQARRRQADKASLVIRMRSKRNTTAVDAVEEARARGWLQRGLVEDADLRGANLKRADFQNASLAGANLSLATLRGADLRGADLTKVNLEQAILIGANLKGSTVSDEQLSLAYILTYAIMPDGSFYNGKFNLLGDLRGALQSNIDIDSVAQMAAYYSIGAEVSEDPITHARMEYYEVSIEEYISGQRWARENLARVREDGLRRLEEWGFEILEKDEQSRVVVFDLDEIEVSDPEISSDSKERPEIESSSLSLRGHRARASVSLLIGLGIGTVILILLARLESLSKQLKMLRSSLQNDTRL